VITDQAVLDQATADQARDTAQLLADQVALAQKQQMKQPLTSCLLILLKKHTLTDPIVFSRIMI